MSSSKSYYRPNTVFGTFSCKTSSISLDMVYNSFVAKDTFYAHLMHSTKPCTNVKYSDLSQDHFNE